MAHPLQFTIYPEPAGSGVLQAVPIAGLDAAFGSAFSHGAASAVALQSGYSMPPDSILREATNLLRMVDVVIGPTPDFGFYLLALRTGSQAAFLKAIAWKEQPTLEKIMSQCQRHRLSFWLLETFSNNPEEGVPVRTRQHASE